MLSFLIRRLAVSGLALASLAGVGVVFGGAPQTRADAPIVAEHAVISELPGLDAGPLEPVADTGSRPRRSTGRRGPDIAWPFFSFSRQRAGGSW